MLVENKKIIFTSGLGSGGAERILNYLIHSFDSGRVLIVNMSAENVTYSKVLNDLGYQVYNFRFNSIVSLHRTISVFKGKEKVSYIGWMYAGCLVATLYFLFCNKGSKLVWNIRQSLYTLRNESKLSVLIIFILSLLSYIPDYIIFNSHQGARHHRKYFLFSKGFIVIANGIVLSQDSATSMASFNKDRFLFVGRFHKIKNYDTFFKVGIELLVSRPSLYIDIYGSGWSENEQVIDSYFTGLDGTVRERLRNNGNVLDIEKIYDNGGILIQTSVSEGFSNVLIEAMYWGCLVVASDVGDTAKILLDRRFLIKNCYDYGSFVNAVKSILSMSEVEIDNLRRKQRFTVEQNYSLKKMITDFKKYI